MSTNRLLGNQAGLLAQNRPVAHPLGFNPRPSYPPPPVPPAPPSRSVHLLKELVVALDSAYWSSWQSTHKFQKQLDEAREWLTSAGQE